jgi:anaerobic selenocysteine-containing dehydrogenase
MDRLLVLSGCRIDLAGGQSHRREFCENGAKAVSWEATPKRVTCEFMAAHSVEVLFGHSDCELKDQNRLSEPMAYDPVSERFLPISWEEAFSRIGAALRTISSPDAVEFYTSGRASNEASFLFQPFGRAFGTNNFPECSNLCHEPTSVLCSTASSAPSASGRQPARPSGDRR